MFHLIDACEYCGTFQRVILHRLEDDGDVVAICHECLKNIEAEEEDYNKEDVKYTKPENFKWSYV